MTYVEPTLNTIPTEPIGSIPRPRHLLQKLAKLDSEDPALGPVYEEAIRGTIEQFEATGSPVVTDGEQRKYHNFLTYCVHGLPNMAPDGFKIPFSDGHTRRMMRLTRGPFRYVRYADSYLDLAMRYAHVPVKQAVISPSALSLMYPAESIPDYPREQFIEDLLGLPVDKLEQIFSAFYTTKPQGTGMGLAITRSIIESHGGRLWATANPERGATFHFTLPTEKKRLGANWNMIH